jgi:hypothetical protein
MSGSDRERPGLYPAWWKKWSRGWSALFLIAGCGNVILIPLYLLTWVKGLSSEPWVWLVCGLAWLVYLVVVAPLGFHVLAHDIGRAVRSWEAQDRGVE